MPAAEAGDPPVKHAFAFDKVFAPAAPQEAVFEEIGELVHSVLDGHKVKGGGPPCGRVLLL